MEARPRAGRWSAVWLLPPVALGAVLRLWNLPAQILSDDELHGVRAALGRPVSEILFSYQLADNCIPLSVLFRLLLDAGLRPSELTLRLPLLISGLLLLAAAPAWAARRLDGGVALVFAGLLALSPGLVFYSRLARPYAAVVLLGFGAVAAFDAWWQRPSWRSGLAYVALAALAVWFHLGAAPLVVSPFLFAAGSLLARRDWTRARALLALGGSTAAALLSFLLPARESLVPLIAAKSREAEGAFGGALPVLELLAGSVRPAVALAVWAVAAAGLVRLFRIDRDLAALSITVVAGHLAGLLTLAPEGLEHPIVFVRYLLPALPWVLLWVAVAVGRPWPALRRVQPALAAAGLVLVLMAGPFVDGALRRSSFAHHNDYLGYHAPRPKLSPQQIPRFYRRLARSPGAGPVIEYPWVPVWRASRSFYVYQEVHRQEVIVAPVRPVLTDPRLAFRNMVAGTPEGFLASRARWVVIHYDLEAEEERLPEPVSLPQPQAVSLFHRLFASAGPMTRTRLRRLWGKPDYADRRIFVWDLERVREAKRRCLQRIEPAGHQGTADR